MENRDRIRLAVAGFLLVTVCAGCHLIQAAADVPGQAVRTVSPAVKTEPSVDPVDVQHTLMRFADEFASRMAIGIDKLSSGTNALGHAESLRWKIAFGTATCSIASGPNAIANLLDMTVFVTEARMSIEEYWQPKVFGESARTLLEDCRVAEKEIWEYAGKVLKPEQQAALSEAIAVWHKQNSTPENLLVARAVGLALQVAQTDRAGTAKPGNLLGLIMLDPLAELDPARRELAQTRLFAERALFAAQELPTLLRWQTELLSYNALEQPALQQWSANVTQITASADRFTRVAEHLPQQLSAEREEIVRALQSQEKELMPVLSEARQALTAGTQMSESLNTTMATFDGVLIRLGVGEPDDDPSSKTNSEPFRIQDYGQVAVQLEAAAKQLTELLQTFDQTLGKNSREALAAQIGPVVQQTQAGSRDVVDYLFWKGVLFVSIVLLAALIYRVLAVLLTRTSRSKPLDR
jgi:hypothetical protein